MLSHPQQSGPQRGEPLADGLSKDFHLVVDGGESALALPDVMTPTTGGSQSWRLLLISLLSCLAASSAAVGAFLWLINLPPTANCENAATVTTDRAQLFCAQAAAESGELADVVAALDLVGGWTEEHPLYQEVRPLVEQWSWVTLNAAERELRDGSMANAQALVSHIPADSAVFATAQDTMQTWQVEWDQGTAIMATAQTALRQTDWSTASRQVQALAELKNPHWRVEQVQALARQIRQERRAQELLSEAVATAAPGGSERLGAALRTASQIEADTYAHQHAQPYLNRWSDLLLKLGRDKWYASDLDAALALGRAAALNPSRAKVAQELIWISQARQMAQQSLITWRTSPDQVVKLYQAMVLANRIPADSPYYPQAQSSVSTWRQHLGELARLQTAQAVGQLRTVEALKAAIDQGAKVPLGHPRRVQAQTMVAHWRQEIERLEDRPQLVNAHELASAKSMEGLRQAIQAANGIALHRALRPEAQSWIYLWTNELQTMEDRPMLAQARSQAQKGNLSQAIAEAQGIKSGRALYDEAQAEIAAWQWEIAAAERARLRALQQAAAAARAAAAAPVPETPDPSALPTPLDGLVPADGLPLAPAPVAPSPRSWRTPLPDRIETMPGDFPTPAAAPGPLLPRSPEASQSAPAPSDMAPSLAPVPLPVAAPEPGFASPPLPAPEPVNLAPELAPELVPEPTPGPQAFNLLAPIGAPTVSARPRPEIVASLRPTVSPAQP